MDGPLFRLQDTWMAWWCWVSGHEPGEPKLHRNILSVARSLVRVCVCVCVYDAATIERHGRR